MTSDPNPGRFTKAIVAALMLLLAGAAAAVAEKPPVETLMVPVAEGVDLSTAIYHPVEEPAPVILIRTPYGRDNMAFMGEAFAARGYVVAVQDVRGKYDSGGEHDPFRNEREDGTATLKWIAGQPWCDGTIGMWGVSYSGYAALTVADAEVDAFKSILSVSGWLDAEKVVLPGGASHLMLNMPWMLTQQGRRQRGLGEFDIEALFRHLPLSEALSSAGITSETWEDPEWLEKAHVRERLAEVKRPVFQIAGWYDMVYRATLDAWDEVTAAADGPAQKLAIGPWHHDQVFHGSFEVGDEDFGETSGFGSDELIELSVRWFDATLRGRDDGILKEPPVSFFLMGQNTWHTSKTWPPPAKTVREERWYLDSVDGANGSGGDGVLARTEPAGAESDRFTFDPMDPVPTYGGANFFYFPELVGIRDQREIEKREDVLVYTSAPLRETLQITGSVSVELHAASTGKDTDLTAKLVVVRPDGYARIVEDGIVRLSEILERVPAPGTPFDVTIDVGQTAISVPEGHRLRLEISSSNFPKYDRNPNTGEHPFFAKELRTAEQTVCHTDGRASYLKLPVRRKPLAATAKARRPLVPPVEAVAAAVVTVEGKDADELLALGREQLEADQIDQAIATLEQAVKSRPDGSDQHLWLGRAYLAKLDTVSMFKKLGWSKKLRASYMRAVELAPDNVDARESLASFYFSAPGVAGGSFEKGKEQVDALRELDPMRAHRLMGSKYFQKKDYAGAAREYRAASAVDPSDPDPYYLLGMAYQIEQKWDDAFEALKKSMQVASGAERDVDKLRALYQIGRTGVLSGQRLPRTIEVYEEYIAAAPDSERLPSVAHAHWRLGMAHQAAGDKDLARQEYETALELDPELEQAREALEGL